MTTAFAALLIGVAGAALLLALAAYLWVNRTPSTEERFDVHGRVPLFGVDLTAAPVAARTSVAAQGDRAERTGNEEPRPIPRPVRTAEDVMADRPSPVGSPVVVDMSAVESSNGNQSPGNQSPYAPPTASDARMNAPLADMPGGEDVRPSDARHAGLRPADMRFADVPPTNGVTPPPDRFGANPLSGQPSANEPRPNRAGWGTSPGWPVTPDSGLASTPRYVPPVRPMGAPNLRPPAPAPPSAAGNGNSVFADGVPGSMIEGHQLRYSTPAEGTLQFLPGRLEISTGLDTGREIRFVRVPGPNGTEVTFGRNVGPLYRHIQLRDQTVSREHARLVFAEGHWVLTNLSKTNPVAYNGRILRLEEKQQLNDGDRLEMGEVVFNFRSR